MLAAALSSAELQGETLVVAAVPAAFPFARNICHPSASLPSSSIVSQCAFCSRGVLALVGQEILMVAHPLLRAYSGQLAMICSNRVVLCGFQLRTLVCG